MDVRSKWRVFRTCHWAKNFSFYRLTVRNVLNLVFTATSVPQRTQHGFQLAPNVLSSPSHLEKISHCWSRNNQRLLEPLRKKDCHCLKLMLLTKLTDGFFLFTVYLSTDSLSIINYRYLSLLFILFFLLLLYFFVTIISGFLLIQDFRLCKIFKIIKIASSYFHVNKRWTPPTNVQLSSLAISTFCVCVFFLRVISVFILLV